MLLNVKLYPEVSNLSRENPPVASFVLRVVSSSGERKAFSHPGKRQEHLALFLLQSQNNQN